MKSKKSLKGMTLVEVIIAMAVLAIAGVVLCTACGFISKIKLTTNALTKRVSYEAPIADCKIYQVKSYDEFGNEVITPYATSVGTEWQKDTDIKDSNGNVTGVDSKICNNALVVSDGANTYTVDGYLYQADYNGLDYGDDDGLISTTDHNFKFFVVGGIEIP